MKTTETPNVAPDFAGAVIEPGNGRTVALVTDLAAWLGVHGSSILLAVRAGKIRQDGRYADAGDAAAWQQFRRRGPRIQSGHTLNDVVVAVAIITTLTALIALAA